MNKTNVRRTEHDVVTGRKIDGEIINALQAGRAYLYEGADHYVLRLNMFSDESTKFFIKKNKDSLLTYTVYSKRTRKDDSTDFERPVGGAYLNEDLKSHLEIKFPLLGRSVFMSLYPSEER
jgi:hypothetical protein